MRRSASASSTSRCSRRRSIIPNVIPVYEAGELDGTLFLIMRWVDGTDLRARLDTDGGQTPSRTIRLLRPVASALAAAHRRGLIHRDIKPANVLIAAADDEGDEHVYLTDFGIAQRTESRGMTRTGVLVGTLDYMAPERIEGGRGTPASDIYAFGCMLYETLSGRVPFDRPTGLAKMHAHINDPVPVDGLPASMAADRGPGDGEAAGGSVRLGGRARRRPGRRAHADGADRPADAALDAARDRPRRHRPRARPG